MKPLLQAHMLNDPFGDPGLLVETLWEHRALLFDMGELGRIRPATLLKVSHAFISHTHIDHFIGFDALLRLMLNRDKQLKIFGPPGFLCHIQGKLSGYTWNLTAEYPFSVQAVEVHPDKMMSQFFHCQKRFAPEEVTEETFNGILHEEPQLQIRATHLDHLIPCLAFALQERFHINVHRERLQEMGFPVGPWIAAMKKALWRGESNDFILQVPRKEKGGLGEKEISLDTLKDCVAITPGQKIVYVADCLFSEENASKIIRLADGADLFFCEAAFLEKERDRAQTRAHLTARQAGELARRSQVKRLHIFHFSPKYALEADLLYREAEEAFQE